MVKRFYTRSGSIYDVDDVLMVARRIGRPQPNVQRIAPKWQPYKAIMTDGIGAPLFIFWPDDVELLPGSPPEAHPATMTSPIVRIEVGRGQE